VSLYDYYYNHDDKGSDNTPNREVKMTDAGRTVYGGGGITPDVKFDTPKPTKFEDLLLQKYAFFNFAKHYLLNRHIQKNFEVDDAVLQDFRKFLTDQNIQFNEADLVEGAPWIKSRIKSELFVSEFGQQEGLKIAAETDPETTRALELMPQAKALAENAKRVIAEKAAARSTTTASR